MLIITFTVLNNGMITYFTGLWPKEHLSTGYVIYNLSVIEQKSHSTKTLAIIVCGSSTTYNTHLRQLFLIYFIWAFRLHMILGQKHLLYPCLFKTQPNNSNVLTATHQRCAINLTFSLVT